MNQTESHVFFNIWQRNYQLLERGEGVYLYDSAGKRYLDGIGGMYVNSIGYGVTEIVEAMAQQACKLSFSHRLRFTNTPQEQLADKVIDLAPTGLTRVFFTTGGSTANEMALRIVRQYHLERGKPDKYKIIGRWHGFHGSTVGTMSMSGDPLGRQNMEPYQLNFPHIHPPYCYQCPFNRTYPSCELICATHLTDVIEQEGPETVAAFIAEPIVAGVGSAITPPPGYYEKIKEICNEYDILFIAEEVVTGFGRTGKNFGINHWNVLPDIITSAKALSSGYAPLGAVIVHQHIWETLRNGQRPGIALQLTYAGHPVSCATALAVQNYVTHHNLIDRCATIGAYLKHQLQLLAEREPLIGDVRGQGLLLGLEFVQNRETHQPFPRTVQLQEQIVQRLFEQGLLVVGRSGIGTAPAGDHISMAPAFIITEEQCDELISILESSLKQVRQTVLC